MTPVDTIHKKVKPQKVIVNHSGCSWSILSRYRKRGIGKNWYTFKSLVVIHMAWTVAQELQEQ